MNITKNGFVGGGGKLIHREADFFLAKITKEESENTKISHEHVDFEWLSLEKALEKMKVKNNKEMLQAAYDFIIEYEKQKKLV